MRPWLRKAATALAVAAMESAAAVHSPAAAAAAVFRYLGGTAKLGFGGKPFLILGGELGNSLRAGTAAQADFLLHGSPPVISTPC